MCIAGIMDFGFFLMRRLLRGSTRTDTLFPYTTVFRSGGGDQAVARARHGNGPEDLPAARLQALGRLVEPRVGDRQRRGDDAHGVGKGEDHRADDDAAGAVDRLAEQQRLQEALVAEEVNERSEEQTSELQSLMRISYAVCCLKKKTRC